MQYLKRISAERVALFCILGLAGIGLLDASYLTAKHFADSGVVCTIIEGCDVVLESQWATLFGLPTASFGILYYLIIFLQAIFVLLKKLRQRTIFWTSSVGAAVSGWFVYLQLFEIQAVCQYCLLSAGISTAVLGAAYYLWQRAS